MNFQSQFILAQPNKIVNNNKNYFKNFGITKTFNKFE